MSGQSPAERLFTLTCCLLAAPRIGLSKQDIFAAVSGYMEAKNDDARERMFDRDKTSLRELGVQLEILSLDQLEETDASRYRVAPGSFVWPAGLELSPKQMGFLELAARAWNNQRFAQSAKSGLGRLKSRGVVQSDREPSFLAPRLLARHKSFEPLSSAIADQELVQFEYRKPDSEATLREVAPLRLRQIQGEWVLLAQEGSEIKNFLLRRIISQVKVTGISFEPVEDALIQRAEADLVDFTKSQLAVIELAEDSEAFWHFGGQELEVKLNYMDEALLAEDLLEFGMDCRVISPDSLAERISKSLQEVVRVHA